MGRTLKHVWEKIKCSESDFMVEEAAHDPYLDYLVPIRLHCHFQCAREAPILGVCQDMPPLRLGKE